MDMEIIPEKELKADSRLYIKGIKIMRSVRLDYKTGKHISFIVKGEEEHSVMYFGEKPGSKRWQCDCKWYTLQNKLCSHIIAVNLAVKDGAVKL